MLVDADAALDRQGDRFCCIVNVHERPQPVPLPTTDGDEIGAERADKCARALLRLCCGGHYPASAGTRPSAVAMVKLSV